MPLRGLAARPGEQRQSKHMTSVLPLATTPTQSPAGLPRLPHPMGRTYVPTALRRQLMFWLHSSPASGHPGIQRSVTLARERYWWPTLISELNHNLPSKQPCTCTHSPLIPCQPSGEKRTCRYFSPAPARHTPRTPTRGLPLPQPLCGSHSSPHLTYDVDFMAE